MSLESSTVDHRESDFLVGERMGLKFYNLFSVKDKEDADKKKNSSKKKPKKKSKKGSKDKPEVSLDNILQTPIVELQSNPSAFNVYATVRQCLLKREVQERAIALSSMNEKQLDEEEDAEKIDETLKLPKIVGIGLRSMFELIRGTYSTHPELCFRAMEALLDMLQGQTPEGLSKEPPEVMDSLFQLLLQLSTSPCSPDTPARLAKDLLSLSTSCLLSMVIARGDTGKLLSAVSSILMSSHHMAGNQMKIPAIVSSLQRSLQSVLIGSICQPDWETAGVTEQSRVETWKIHGIKSSSEPATIATDGAYMYLHNNTGLYKVGTGYAGTIKGHLYHLNPEFCKDQGWIGVVNNQLLFCSRDKPAKLRKINLEKLEEEQLLPIPLPGNSVPAVLFSDGELIGTVTATDQDTFRIQTWHPSGTMQQKGSELYVKLARKSTEVYGPSLTDQAKDKTKHILDLGSDIDCLEVTAGKDFAFARTNSGKVMFAGKAHSLGMKREGQGASKWTALTIQKSPKIVQCAVGHEGHHALMVADDGAVYFTGLARRGEDGDQVKGQRNAKANKPKKVLKMDGKHTIYAACNSGSSAMVTKEGELYMFGKDTQEVDPNTGLVTELKDIPVLQVALGKQHTCVLTKAGMVWTSGINKRGQCGRGPPPGQQASKEGVAPLPAEEEVEEEEVDKEEETLCDHEWKHEQCMICTICNECTGYGANCINTINADRNPGNVCGCGSGDSGCSKCGSCRNCAGEGKGQLRGGGGAMFQNLIRHKNITDRDLLAQLQQVFFKKDGKSRLDKIVQESKAFDEGSVSGDDREGEKEICQPNILTLAEIVINDNKIPAVQVVCGSYHTVVLLRNGEVYTFGMGNHGQLGQGDSDNRYSPCRVPVTEPITQIAAGNHHTVLLATSGCVYTFGQFQKGQLGRPVNEEKKEPDAKSHLVPGLVPGLGPESGRKGNWVQASGDRTFVKVDESLIGANTLEKSLVFATFKTIGIIPKEESSGVKCLMVNRSEGQCRSFSEVNSINQCADCVTFDPIYNVLWSYNTETCEVASYSAVKPRIKVLTSQPGQTLSVFSPELALPNTNQGHVTSSQCALYILASLDTLTAAHLEGWSVEGLENQTAKPPKAFTKEDFNVVQRFEAYGGGWGYSGHSIEALRVSVDTNVELGGLGLFGGRGEYTAKIAIFDLGSSSEYEGEGELLAESDDIIYECGAKETFPVLFDEPVPLTAGHWYTITAKISGPSSDCGSSGQPSVTTEDQVVFTFKSSRKTNNGTDVNAGQIPQILYRFCQQDSGLSRRETQLENVHILDKAFSNTVTPEAFESLTKLLEWSLTTFRDVAKETTVIKGTALTAILLDLERLVYIATATMRLLRNYICEIYSKTGKQATLETSQLAECVGNTGILLRMILTEPSRLSQLLGEKGKCLELWQRIQNECDRTFVQCFHAFYPTYQLKWTCLCWQLNTMNQVDANNGYLLASVLEALCDTSIRLTSVLPITKDHEVELVLMKHSSMDDNFPTMVSTDPMSSKFPELVAHMEQTTQVETGSCNSFREMLNRLLDILSISVREMMREDRPSYPKLLVTNTCSLLGCLVSELAAISTGTESENQATSRPLCKTPSRFSRCSQARGWSTGNGTPDAICFSVDKPGIVIAGFCVYGGHSRYNYELELLDNSEGGDGHGHRWNTLELIKGMYCPDDCTNDIAEIKFEKPVPIKEGVKYAVRLRNHGSRTVNGDNGMSSVKCSDGVTFTFTSCVLSSNGTNHTRGQIPQILYYNTALECEKSGPETKSADMEYQARKNALYVTSAIVHTACDLLKGAEENLKGSEIANTLGVSELFTHLLPLVLAHTAPVGSSDPRSAVQVLGLVKELLPLVTAVNLQTDPPLNYSSTNGQSGDLMTDSNSVTTSSHYAVVESDHPYKIATVSHYKVKYPETVKWLVLEFDQQCGTAQPEDSLQLYIPARGQQKPVVQEGEDIQQINTHWAVLNRFYGDSNWPSNSVILPGNEVIFSLETASDYVKDEKANRYGFKCAVVGYEWLALPRQGLLHLEKELSHIGGMCASSLMKKELCLPPEEEETEEEPEPITEAAQQIFNIHSVLLSKGFALARPPTIHQALSGNLPINTEYNERSFLQDYVHCTANTSGGRLARWLQPESYVEPKQCDIIYQREEIKCRKATVITLKTHDQYGILVHVPQLKVEAEAVPLGKQEHHLDSGSQSMKSNRKGEKDMTFGGHPMPQVDTSFEPVIRKDSMAYNSITMMKEYENYSFEELRFAHLPAKRPSESMLVRANNDGSYSAHWTPGLSGLYAIHFTIDGYSMDEVPKVDVGEPPQGVVPPPPVKKVQSLPNKTRQFVAKFSSGLRIRRSPSLQSEQIGKIDVNGIITYVDEIQNEDGVWVRLNKDSIHRFCGTNGFREAWCMQFNQHVGKTFLIPVDPSKNLKNDENKENQDESKKSLERKMDKSKLLSSLVVNAIAEPGLYHVIHCGASGHNIRCGPSLKDIPIGMMVQGNHLNVIQVKRQDGCLWVKLDLDSMSRYCDSMEGEAWALAKTKGNMYLVHDKSLNSELKKENSELASTQNLFKINGSTMPTSKTSGFDFRSALTHPAFKFNMQEVQEIPKMEPFVFGGGGPFMSKSWSEESEGKVFTDEKPQNLEDETSDSDVKKTEKPQSRLLAQKIESRFSKMRASSPGRLQRETEASNRQAGTSSPARVLSRDSSPASRSASLDGHFSIGTGSGPSSPKMQGSPKMVRKARSQYSRRERTSSPSGKDRSPARTRGGKRTEIKDVARPAIAPSVAECVRTVFAAFLWHEGIVHDAMACASYLKFNPGLTKQAAQREQDKQDSGKNSKVKNRHSMDLSKAFQDGSFLANMGTVEPTSNKNEMSSQAKEGKAADKPVKISEIRSKSSDHISTAARSLEESLKSAAAWQKDRILLETKASLSDDIRSRSSSAGPEDLHKSTSLESARSKTDKKTAAETESALPLTLQYLLSFWEELTSATVNVASQKLVLPSPAPITKSKGRVERREREKEKESKSKKKEKKSIRGGRGNLFGEAAGIPAGGSDQDAICDLCHGSFPHPVTYHMKQAHPGCGKHAGGQGYNSSGHYCGGWAGNCGDGGIGGSSWYLMCDKCKEKYVKERQEKAKEKIKKLKVKPLPLKTPKVLPPLEAHNVMKANAMFLLDLASSAGTSLAGGLKSLNQLKRFELPSVSEIDPPSLQPQFPLVPFKFLNLMEGNQVDQDSQDSAGNAFHLSGEDAKPLLEALSTEDRQLGNVSFGPPQHSISTSSLADQDALQRVMYVRSISMTTSGEQYDGKTKVRRRINSGNSSASESGSSLLRRPSVLLAKLMDNSPRNCRALHRPVMTFIAQRHDLEGLRLAMRQAVRKAACRVYALQAFNWLLRSVTQLNCLHDLLWHFVVGLAPAPTEKEEESDEKEKKKEKNAAKEPDQEKDNIMCEHPLSDIIIAGDAVNPLPTAFHSLLQTISDMMMQLPIGSALQQMAMRCWCLRFQPADHMFLHHSHVFSNINKILSKSEGEVDEGGAAVNGIALEKNLQNTVELLKDLTGQVEIRVSSRAAMCSSLTDGATETFWESGDEDRNKTKWISLAIPKGLVARGVMLHIDNSRDLANKVTQVTFQGGSNTEDLVTLQIITLDHRHSGWIACDLMDLDHAFIKVTLKGPDNHVRVRQVKFLGYQDGSSISIGQVPALVAQQKNCEAETLRVFRLLTSQVFGKLLAEDMAKNGKGKERTKQDSGDPDLKEHMVGILFSNSKLTNLQKQVCSHIVQAIHKETTKTREEWEFSLTKQVEGGAQTEEKQVSSADAYCFELLSMVLALSGSSVGRVYVAQKASLVQDLLSLLHTGSPRVQRQVTAILRKVLPEITPNRFASVTGSTLPIMDINVITTSAEKPKATEEEETIGVLEVFLAVITKALTVQTKMKAAGSGKVVQSITLASTKINGTDEGSSSKRWWIRGSMSHSIAESIIVLIKDIAMGKLGDLWASVCKAAVAEALLALTRIEESKRVPAECLQTHTLWLSLASLCVLEQEHVERLSSSELSKKDGQAAKHKPLCVNHDDGETPAIVSCNQCGNLCADCDKFLHLHNRTRSHQRQVFKEEEEAIRVDLHEGCGRSKLFWVMILADSKTLKAMIDFKEAGSTSNSHGSSGRGSCRFCGGNASGLTASAVCEDCQEYAETACTKVLRCEHICGGLKGEEKHLPCLQGCSNDPTLKQDSDDMCMICFTEALCCAPAIQLMCGHVFHYHCCLCVLEKRWVGPRITFGFVLCPICKVDIENKMLESILEPIKALKQDVKRKALMRLEYEGLNKCEAITTPGARFHHDPAGFAINRYAYYVCFKCKKAYYGGEARCDEGGAQEYDPAELVCGGCSDVSRAQMCPKHGTDFLEYKCRYCCSVAVFFCFGTTHFCNACHDDFQRITTIGKQELPRCPAGPKITQMEGDECPLHVDHPPTGEEFALGCGVCRNAHTF